MVGLAATALGVSACGDEEKAEPEQEPPPAAQTESEEPNPVPTQAPSKTNTTGAGAEAEGTIALAADPAGDLAFDKTAVDSQAGSITIDFTNRSQVAHDVQIERGEREVGGTETIMQSQTSVDVDLRPGSYTFYCSVANHQQAGMEGTITVE